MPTNRLKICSWNINGYKSLEIGNKFRDKEFLKSFAEVDFIGLTETHIHEETLECMNIPGFKLFSYKNQRKNLKSGKAPGGIAIFIREYLSTFLDPVKLENEDAIWVKVKKELTGEEKDIYIGTCYLNPARKDKNPQHIINLTENILSLKNKGHVIINGDLNARTGGLDDTISPDKYDEVFNIINICNIQKRNSEDKIVNQRGNELLDLCKSFDINIANGRKNGDLFGKYTCFKWNGSSVVDYLLASNPLFDQISSFKVGKFTPWFSDHSPIYSTLDLRTGIAETSPEIPKEKAPKRFVWSEAGKQKFLNMLNSHEFSRKLDNVVDLDYEDPNNVVNCVSDVLINAAEKANIKTTKKNDLENPPWFDTECENTKQNMALLGRKVRQNPRNLKHKKELFDLKKRFKKIVRNKKVAYKDKIMEKMNWSSKDSKKFWKLLDKMDQKQDNSIFTKNISEGRWLEHFQSVTQGPHGKCVFPKNTAKQGYLDFAISDDEIRLSTYILRNGKASGHDSISNEMISCLLVVKPEIVKKLFNAILKNPTTIGRWNISLIVPLHKKGSKTDTDNYRGISLLSCFSKFFLAILNLRLNKFAVDKIFSNGQLGFLKGSRTSDALLILYNLIDYYCGRMKKHIFGCFVDFRKAFDSVPRDKLFQKLLNNNINGKFYDCLVNLYKEDKSCIKIGDGITRKFTSNQGVKQGCILSPTLFNIFLSDLQPTIEHNFCEPIQINTDMS